MRVGPLPVCRLAKMDVVLTTYNLISREVGAPPSGTTKAVTDMPVKEDVRTNVVDYCDNNN